jgi:hypothetical protein
MSAVSLSPRALHRVVQQRLNARFETGWSARPPFANMHAAFLERVRALADWPAPEQYGELARSVPPSAHDREPLPHFVTHDRDAVSRAGGYERHVARLRAVPTRPRHWHDFFNMAVWAHFPRMRWALNAVHVDEAPGPVDPRNGRSASQSAAAQFDESGMVVTGTSASLLGDLQALRFKRVFWERRAELLETTRFWLIGHGAFESLMAPHLGLAAKAVLLPLDHALPDDALRHLVDAQVSALVRRWKLNAPRLDPIPLLGIPGYADNDAPEFYDDAQYFRIQRRAT